jgi:hypothetical protein
MVPRRQRVDGDRPVPGVATITAWTSGLLSSKTR